MKKNILRPIFGLMLFTLLFFSLPMVSGYADVREAAVLKNRSLGTSGTGRRRFHVIRSKNHLMKRFRTDLLKLRNRFSYKIPAEIFVSSEVFERTIHEALRKSIPASAVYRLSYLRSHYTYTRIGNYYYTNYFAKYSKPKREMKRLIARSVKQASIPLIKTREELLQSVIRHTENLNGRFSLKVVNSVLNPDDPADLDAFWDSLYDRPEYNDLSRYIRNPQLSFHSYDGYFIWNWSLQYDIHKNDVNYLKSYVKEWVASHILPSMTEEEKIRTINDFMVKEYRYSFGDKGQLYGTEIGKEKLGNHSVYTCFSLIFGKGGVCNAKANMFYRLAKEAGLSVLYITGKGNGEEHAWNMVKADGIWYHLDNTWNRGYYEGSDEYTFFNSREYYLKGDESMSKDHSWDRSKYPAAPMDYPGYIPSVSSDLSSFFFQVA